MGTEYVPSISISCSDVMHLPGPASIVLRCLPVSMSQMRILLSRLLEAATVVHAEHHIHHWNQIEQCTQ